MKPANASILTINGGSSSIKFALYQVVKPLERGLYGKVDRIGLSGANLTSHDPAGKQEENHKLAAADHKSAANFLIDWLEERKSFESVRAVGHRVTNIGSGYRPVTFGGHVLCLGISIFAVAIFGYLTAVFAAFFIGRDAEDPKSEIPNQTSIHQLSAEVALLRKAIEEVLKRVPPAAPQPAESPQLIEESTHIKRGNVSAATGQSRA